MTVVTASRRVALAAALALGAAPAWAYTAAGDRSFPATIVLPQLSPTDEFYLSSTSQPQTGGGRVSNLTAVYDKLITDRLAVAFTGGRSWLDLPGQPTQDGWQNVAVNVHYLAALNPQREFALSFGVEHEFGDTGTRRAGASRQGATTPAAFLGKGLGDYDIGYLRPLALIAMLGYQVGDSSPRADQLVTGFVVQYSIPYLESKVKSFNLPLWLANLTPMVEVQFTTPVGAHAGSTTQGVVAPGFNWSGQGWDVGVEALLPTNRASGGAGFALQLHLSLDYLFPTSIGKPLFSGR